MPLFSCFLARISWCLTLDSIMLAVGRSRDERDVRWPSVALSGAFSWPDAWRIKRGCAACEQPVACYRSCPGMVEDHGSRRPRRACYCVVFLEAQMVLCGMRWCVEIGDSRREAHQSTLERDDSRAMRGTRRTTSCMSQLSHRAAYLAEIRGGVDALANCCTLRVEITVLQTQTAHVRTAHRHGFLVSMCASECQCDEDERERVFVRQLLWVLSAAG